MVFFNTIVFLLTVSHLRAVMSDPGIVPIPKTNMDFSDIHSDTSKRKTVSSLIYFHYSANEHCLEIVFYLTRMSV